MLLRTTEQRRSVAGAECHQKGVHFRVWAPRRKTAEVLIDGRGFPLNAEDSGYFSGLVADARPGTLYKIRLDGADAFPDPASRYQPEGPHGPSEVIDTQSFRWTDAGWKGVPLTGQVIYELHIGTFTTEGTWQSATAKLSTLADLGVTVVELMPVAEFPGRFGWGYDGVGLYSPYRLYGRPEEFAAFVDRAHSLGMGVILDVVYNHLGPDGNYVAKYSEDYFTDKHETDWGEAINFDGANSGPVRDFFAGNAAFWVGEYHLDGLRLDATQNIYDDGPHHILALIGERVREAANGRSTIVVAENEPQHTRLVRPVARGGYGLDGLWNDDLHHSIIVALTGRNDAYYTDYNGEPQEFVSAAKYGYLYQGQRYKWQKKRRGTPAFDVAPAHFITFAENHDQVANSGRGARLHQLTSPGRMKAITAFVLLGGGTPMLFQGQEFNSSAPFLFFADHQGELANLVAEGRRKFLEQWRSLSRPEMQACLAAPHDEETFERCKLDWSDLDRNLPVWDMHRDLLRLRREDPVFRSQRIRSLDGAVIGAQAFVIRFFGDQSEDRLLIVNLGRDLHLDPAPEPLLAPPEQSEWRVLFSTEDPIYGGCGTAPLDTEENWRIPGEAAVVLAPSLLKTVG